MGQDDVHERSGGLFVPDTVLPEQYFDRLRRRHDLSGEQRLMYAILEDAVDIYLKHAGARRPHHRRLFEDAERWVESDARGQLYAFAAICDQLGLDVEYLRAGLRAHKERARRDATGDGEQAAVPAGELRRASNE